MRKLILRSIGLQIRKVLTKNAKNYFIGPKNFADFCFRRRKMKRRESSETRFRGFSWRTDVISRGKRTFEFSKIFRNLFLLKFVSRLFLKTKVFLWKLYLCLAQLFFPVPVLISSELQRHAQQKTTSMASCTKRENFVAKFFVAKNFVVVVDRYSVVSLIVICQSFTRQSLIC